ncbi:MAG TPA: response regulator, partial [Polyangiales bacterium]
MKPRVLVVDDKQDLAEGVALVLSEITGDVRVAHCAQLAIEQLTQRPADLVFSDVRMPGMDGVSLLSTIQARWPRTRVVLLTAFGTVSAAVDAMKLGAFHYLLKPFDNDELLLIARRAWESLQEKDELARLRGALEHGQSFHGIMARAPRMLAVLETVRKAA